jgi:mRNA interferase MazF
MKKGDIVLIPFPFADLSGNKNRPAVVLIDSENDVTVCFITTQFKWQSDYDIYLEPTELNGLKRLSLVRLNKFATIDKRLVLGKLGDVSIKDMELLNKNLIKILKLG